MATRHDNRKGSSRGGSPRGGSSRGNSAHDAKLRAEATEDARNVLLARALAPDDDTALTHHTKNYAKNHTADRAKNHSGQDASHSDRTTRAGTSRSRSAGCASAGRASAKRTSAGRTAPSSRKRTASSRKRTARGKSFASSSGTPRRSSMPPLTIILWILLALLALWMAMRALPAGADHASPTQIQLTALTPLLWLPLAVIGVWALARHTPAQAIVAIVLLLVNLLFSAGYAVRLPGGLNTALGNPAQSTMSAADRSAALASCSGADSASADSATRCVTVMTVNARYGKADASAIVHAAKQYDVDVLAIQEVYGDLKSRLDEEGLGEVFPHCVLGAQSDADNGGVNAICSRVEPFATTDDAVDAKAAHVPAVTLTVDGVNVTFVSAHVASPHRGADRWGDGLAALTRLGTPSGAGAPDPVVLMGDLNANLSHASYRAMLRNGGFSDVSYEMHGGAHLSFPASWSFVPSLLELDHVVHTQGVTGLDMRTLSIPRTDHKAQIATLRIDGAA